MQESLLLQQKWWRGGGSTFLLVGWKDRSDLLMLLSAFQIRGKWRKMQFFSNWWKDCGVNVFLVSCRPEVFPSLLTINLSFFPPLCLISEQIRLPMDHITAGKGNFKLLLQCERMSLASGCHKQVGTSNKSEFDLVQLSWSQLTPQFSNVHVLVKKKWWYRSYCL